MDNCNDLEVCRLQLNATKKELDRIKRTPIKPIYTCGGHGYEDDDDEDFWCPVCFAHLGTHRGFADICPVCKQAIEKDWDADYSYKEIVSKAKTYGLPTNKEICHDYSSYFSSYTSRAYTSTSCLSGMEIKDNKIVKTTEDALFNYYLKRNFDEIYSFATFKEKMLKAGVKITK